MLRVLGILLTAALVAALFFGACVSACGVALISVVAEDSPNIVAPVPLLLPLAAIRFAPEHVFDDTAREKLDRYGGPALSALGAALRELEEVDDAVLVRVTEGEDQVHIAKEGDDFVVRVREGGAHGARVFVRAPVRALREAAAACEPEASSGVRCDLRQIAHSLIAFARGAEVEVRDGETRVDISVW